MNEESLVSRNEWKPVTRSSNWKECNGLQEPLCLRPKRLVRGKKRDKVKERARRG